MKISNYYTIVLISHASKFMLKILQARLQQYMNWELQMYRLGFEEAEEPEVKLPIFTESWRKQGSSRKTSTSASLTMLKPLTVGITTNCGKFLKRWEYQITWPASWEICMQIKKQQLQLDMEQLTGSRSGKEFIKDVYCHPAYLTYMQSTSCKMPGCINHKLESRLPGEITSDRQVTPLLRRKVNFPPWDKVKVFVAQLCPPHGL